MARKTNKTDHVLNLLSSGGKKTSPKKEEKDTPPVDLRPKKPAPENDEPEPEESEEMEIASSEEALVDAEPAIGADVAPSPRVEAGEAQQKSEPAESDRLDRAAQSKTEPTTISVQPAETSKISVVHTSGEENPIADAVKSSLEAELDAYMEQKLEQETEEKPEEKIEQDLEQKPEQNLRQKPEPKPEQDAGDRRPEPLKTAARPEKAIDVSALLGAGADEAEPVESVPEAEPEAEVVKEIVPEVQTESVAGVLDENTATSQPESSAAEAQPKSQTAPEPQAVAESQTAPEPQAAAEPQTGEAVQKAEEKSYTILNVMEALVRDQVPKYVRQFGHCDCDRCIEDTIALALTHLPAKYVVIDKNTVAPMLTYYEKRYAGQLIVEITKATMVVNEAPNH